jgi:DNA-directed RNA polymerase beta' subunit
MPAGFHLPTSDIESVVGIQFGIFSPDEIVKRSVVEITSQGTYEGNEPKIGGLFDPRMGVLDNGKTCRSCGQTNHNCPGHFGHYRLARPVYFIQFLPLVLNVLRCVCIRCSKLLIDKASNERVSKRRGEARWREVLNICSTIKRCGQQTEDGCGTLKPDRFVRDGIARIIAEWDNTPDVQGNSGVEKVKQPLEVEYVQRLFRQILDEDVDFMGLSRHWCRPDWMICSVLPVPPPQVRPSVIQDNNQRSEDDLTHKLFEIIKVNKQLQDKIDKNVTRQIIDEYTNILQYHVATLVDNKIPGVAPSAQRGGRPLKSIQQRIGSKEGRVRYNIQGKRVEQSARTVITGDPNLSVAEVGVPMKIAMNLTRPEKVTKYNRQKLYKYVQNGADVFPGAKSVIRADGRMISLKHVNTKEIVLYNGDTVNRHLMDGDMLLFNRQPTLHRMSMMGHKVRVLPFNTFRLNVQVVRPYNADFDGDEMNAHIPQSYEASVELEDIAAVPHQIIRPRDGTPVITVVQDTLVGAHIATKPQNFFTRREFMNLMMWNKRFESLPQAKSTSGVANSPRYTGQQIIGSLMPPISLDMPNKMFKKTDPNNEQNMVRIREGDVLQGVFDKDIFNKPGRGIIHTTYNDYGPTQTVNLLDGLQQVLESFLIMKGFSVGISDMIADQKTREEMNEVIRKCKAEVEETLLQVHMDLFTNNTGKTNQEEFETRVFATLNKALEAGKIGEGSLSVENRLTAMIRAGSKGDSVNISQMIACLGQQAPEGRRIPYGFTDRTLPHYKKYDDGAEARGFVESSFIRGLTPQEFFFHAMSGREGLIDTAVKTSETGYTQRQLIKAMEDLIIHHDGTVRDANGGIVQFYYGEDGINSTKIENISIPLDKMTEQEIKMKFGLGDVDWSTVLQEGVQGPVDTALLDEFVGDVSTDRKMLIEGVYMSGRSLSLFAPMDIERVIKTIRIKFNIDSKQKTNLSPDHVLDGIRRLIKRTQPHNKVWTSALRYHLSPHLILVKERFTKEAFDTLLEMVVVKCWKASAQPGELVGIIAAQSIGEPATQMTLNSVDWDTKIMIAKNGKIISPQIGEFIDTYLENEKNKDRIKTLPNDQLYIELTDGNDWQAISTDENGKMMWTKLEAITRHPVVNEDGSNTILEVTLASGRRVKATKGKSFLTEVNGKVQDINGSDLKIGDKIPIANSLDVEKIGYVTEINLREILPPSEWIYGTDVESAISSMHLDRTWFQKNQGVTFTIPYARSDSFREAFVDGKNSNNLTIKSGYVYPKKTRPDVSQIPETIQLDNEFGFFVGAYLAEGMSNSTQINITNNDPVYFEKIQSLLSKWNVGSHIVQAQRESVKTHIKGLSTSIVIHSTLLAKVMNVLFGRVSYEKTLPDWVFQAPDVFVRGLVDGYISGDGTIEKRTGCVKVTSVSNDLVVRFGTLLARYGIFSTISSNMPDIGLFDSVKMNYTLYIPAKYSNVFAHTFGLSIISKQEILDYHHIHNSESRRCRRGELNTIVWDTVKSIKEVVPIKGWVYDLTVETTRNFTTLDCIAVKDTFHQAGVASKSNMTRGVPRLKEILKVTQNPKATSLTIYLKPEFRDSKDRIREVVQDLELTLLRDIVLRACIYYDPSNSESIITEDRDLLAFYNAFELQEAENSEQASDDSKWVLRLEFDREKMFNRSILMDDVYFVLKDKFSEVNMIYSDHNSQKLVMRFRIRAGDTVFGDDLEGLKKFQNKILTSVVIRGIPGIRAATFRKDENRVELVEGEYKQITQYIIDTDGSNFLEVRNHPAVDGNKLYSTNIHDIYNLLGVEATRAILYQELSGLFEEAGINYRHLGLLVDTMTRNGRLMSIDRYGINKNDIGPLAKACFEETEKILLKAAQFGEMDPVTGVSANIMMGQPIRCGTAFSQILLDESAFVKMLEALPEDLEEEEKEVDELDDDEIQNELYADPNDMCSATQLRMNVQLPLDVTAIEEPELEFNVI